MSFLWDSIKSATAQLGSAAAETGYKAKVQAEVLLIDRKITARQHTFGTQLYDHVAPLSKHPDFYASDDVLTATIRPPLINAQKEISVLLIKQTKLKEKMKQAEVTRAATVTPATNWQDTLVNVGKSTVLAGSEAKNSTEMALIEGEIVHHKQQFGVDVFGLFVDLEDTKGWLPTNRDIRTIYDNCRQDVEKLKKQKVDKEKELGMEETSSNGPVPIAPLSTAPAAAAAFSTPSYGDAGSYNANSVQQPSYGGGSMQPPSYGGSSVQQPSYGGSSVQQPSYGGTSTQNYGGTSSYGGSNGPSYGGTTTSNYNDAFGGDSYSAPKLPTASTSSITTAPYVNASSGNGGGFGDAMGGGSNDLFGSGQPSGMMGGGFGQQSDMMGGFAATPAPQPSYGNSNGMGQTTSGMPDLSNGFNTFGAKTDPFAALAATSKKSATSSTQSSDPFDLLS